MYGFQLPVSTNDEIQMFGFLHNLIFELGTRLLVVIYELFLLKGTFGAAGFWILWLILCEIKQNVNDSLWKAITRTASVYLKQIDNQNF